MTIGGYVNGYDATLVVGDHAEIDITGNFEETAVTLGGPAATTPGDKTIFNVGSVGNVSGSTGDWVIYDEVDVTVTNDFIGADASESTVTMNGNAKLTANGQIIDFFWDLFDDAEVHAEEDSDPSIVGGTWVPWDDSSVTAHDIEDGIWVIRDNSTVSADNADGGIWNVVGGTLDVAELLNPETLTIQSGGTVECDDLSQNDVVWNMSLNGGPVTATGNAWHDGTHPQANDIGGYSILRLSSSNTSYSIGGELTLMGELTAVNGTADIEIGAGFLAATEIVRVDGSTTHILDFDAEAVSLAIDESFLEAIGPDYDLSTDGPLFTDSPCVRPWSELEVIEGASSNLGLVDGYISTPISGSDNRDLYDAVYVTDITIESGATIDGDDTIPQGVQIYFIGNCKLEACESGGDDNCFDGACTSEFDDAFDDVTPIKLKETEYGDFDADMNADETDDTDRFLASWCRCGRDSNHCTYGDYEALTDWDCDGDVDNDDLAQYESTWGQITAFDGLDCAASYVCHESNDTGCE